jgi:hypothetical protein
MMGNGWGKNPRLRPDEATEASFKLFYTITWQAIDLDQQKA